MKITALLRVRNESLLLPDTLKHLSEISDEIFVFDDASEDNSMDIYVSYPKVKTVIRNFFHSKKYRKWFKPPRMENNSCKRNCFNLLRRRKG